MEREGGGRGEGRGKEEEEEKGVACGERGEEEVRG